MYGFSLGDQWRVSWARYQNDTNPKLAQDLAISRAGQVVVELEQHDSNQDVSGVLATNPRRTQLRAIAPAPRLPPCCEFSIQKCMTVSSTWPRPSGCLAHSPLKARLTRRRSDGQQISKNRGICQLRNQQLLTTASVAMTGTSFAETRRSAGHDRFLRLPVGRCPAARDLRHVH